MGLQRGLATKASLPLLETVSVDCGCRPHGFPGADVEIIGLLYSTVSWLAGLHKQGKFAHDGAGKFPQSAMSNVNAGTVKYQAWAETLKSAFESWFWVPVDAKDDASYHVDKALINRRGIYKVLML